MADDRERGGRDRNTSESASLGGSEDQDSYVNGHDEPDFSDPEDYVDNITDEELLGDILKQKPKEADGIDSVIVVDSVPQVGPERLEKLQNVIRKIFSKFGKIVSEYFPEENGKTKGYIFLEYSSPANALEAVRNCNGYKLDKQHTFAVNLFSDFDKYSSIPEEWEPPETQPYKDPGNLWYWLEDAECNDQYSVIYDGGERTAIFLNTYGGTEQSLVEERARWTETYVRWSPKGTYLATFHQRGIALWGGEKFRQIQRFSHQGVQLIDFSPCEKYMVTFSPLIDSKDEPQAIIIWDISTGGKRRGFHCENAAQWPIFKWSFDGKYFARMGQDSLSVYETPSFGLLEKKSMKIPNIREFFWSPTDNIIAYWTPEKDNIPARVTLLEIPTRLEIQTKNLFSVADCKIYWQKQGDYLCVKVDRYTKSKKGLFYNLELFRMREKQIPVDVVEVKEVVNAFAWEPNGEKFVVLHGESPRINASVYKMSNKVELLKCMEKKQANHIFWSPQGQFVVLAGLRSMNGALEFIDTNDMTVMNVAEHFMATDVEWDPTGRYVITAVSWWGHKVDNAFWLWSFQGRLLHKQNLDRFCQLLWRPRPPSPLTAAQIKKIKKNLKQYQKQFEIKDKMRMSKASKELVEKRHAMMQDFEKYRKKKRELCRQQKEQRLALRGGVDTDRLDSDAENVEEETVEFFVKEETIVVSK